MSLRSVLIVACTLALAQDPFRDALNLGHTHDAALFDSFNRGYALSASGTIDSAEIITEFRRAALLVRQREALGDYIQDTRTVSNALAPFAGLVTFVVQARLNPLNTYHQAPNYELYISTGPSTKPLAGKPFLREPIYPMHAPAGAGMIAVRLTASFPRADIESAPRPSLVVTDDRAELLWQARLDLGRYR
ncbi:MAG TPA: hypothetical protein VFZ98_12830 [Vicinamibacterales bacterium]